MGWWWNLTVEWPAALGDWLWNILVAPPAATLKGLTFRRIFTVLALTILVVMFAQMAPIDLAVLFAGDALTYFEALGILWLFAAKGQARELARLMKRMAKTALRRLTQTVGGMTFHRSEPRRRDRRTARRIGRFGRSRNAKGEPGMPVRRRVVSGRRLRPRYLGTSSGGVCAFSPRRTNSVHASSAVSTKLNRPRSAAAIVPSSTIASKLITRCQ
jgi:hypothetical protein